MALTTGRVKFDVNGIHAVTTGIGASAADANIEHKINLNRTVPNGTSQPATVIGSFALTLSSSTAFLDLNALPIGNGATSDCTGLKLQTLVIKNPTGNGDLTLSYGTSSPYNFAGTAFSVGMGGNGSFFWDSPEEAADVSTSARYILATGTGTQSFHALVICG